MSAASYTKFGPTFTPRELITPWKLSPSATKCSRTAGASPSWEIPKITRPRKLSDHVSRRAVRERGTARDCSAVQPHFDCPPWVNGRHHSHSSRRWRVAAGVSRGNSRLGDRRTLG